MVLADRGVVSVCSSSSVRRPPLLMLALVQVCIDEFDKMSDMDRVAIHEVSRAVVQSPLLPLMRSFLPPLACSTRFTVLTCLLGSCSGDGAADGDDRQGRHPHVAQRALQRRRRRKPNLWPGQSVLFSGPLHLMVLTFT